MRVRSRVASLLLTLALVPAIAYGADIALPTWTSSPDSCIAFMGPDGKVTLRVEGAECVALLYGFRGTARGISIDGRVVVIESFELSPPEGGAFSLPKYAPADTPTAPTFRNLRIRDGYAEKVEADCGRRDFWGYSLGGIIVSIDGWSIHSYGYALSPAGLTLSKGYIWSTAHKLQSEEELSISYFLAAVSGLVFSKAWKLQGGWGSLSKCRLEVISGPLRVKSAALLVWGGDLTMAVKVESFELGMGSATPFQIARFDGWGKILKAEKPKASRTVMGLGVRLEFSVESITSERLIGSGELTFPESLVAREPFRCPSGSVSIDAPSINEDISAIIVDRFDGPIMFSLQGWEISSDEARLGYVDPGDDFPYYALVCERATVMFRGTPITFERLIIDPLTGYIRGMASITQTDLSLPVFGGRLAVRELSFNKYGIAGTCVLSFPAPFDSSIYIDTMVLNPDGSFDFPRLSSGGVYRTEVNFSCGNLTMENFFMKDDGLHCGRITLDLVSGPVKGSFFAYQLVFKNDDSLAFPRSEIGSFGIGPFSGQGRLTYADGVFTMTGSLYANDGAFQTIDGSIVSIRLPADGSPPSIEADSIVAVTLPFGNRGLSVRASGTSIVLRGSDVAVRLDGSNLDGAARWIETNAKVDGVLLYDDGRFDFSEAVLSAPFEWKRPGFTFVADALSSWDEDRAIFTGKAIIQGKDGKVEYAKDYALRIDSDGSVRALVADGTKLIWFDRFGSSPRGF